VRVNIHPRIEATSYRALARVLRAAPLTALLAIVLANTALAQTRPPGASPAPRSKVTDIGRHFRESPPHVARQPELLPPARARTQLDPLEPAPGPADGADLLPDALDRAPQRLRSGNGTSLGQPPRPSEALQAEYGQYVERTIDPEATIDVIEGRPRLMVFRQTPLRLQIADEEVATYQLITERELSLVGVRSGSTVLNIWFQNANNPDQPRVLSYLVRVLQDPDARLRLDEIYRQLEAEINQAFPNSQVCLSFIGDKLVVRGEAKDIVEAAQIMQVVNMNLPDTGQETTVEQVNFQQQNYRLGGGVTPFGVGDPVVNAYAFDSGPGMYEGDAIRAIFDEAVNNNVLNLLHVPGEQQVMLRVTVAEVNRSAARSIGLDFSITNDNGVRVFAQVTNAVTTGGAANALTQGANLPTLLDNGQVSLAIRALRTMQFARSLAEPNLVTLNGQPAFFRAGGQFPVPAAQLAFGGVGQGVAFVPFGVTLRFVPYITDRDRVRISVGAAVSTRDEALGTSVGGSANAGGTQVSGLQARTFQTSVELREGQTLAVAGLIQQNFGSRTNRVPFWGDLPIIGHTGGRTSDSADEQELVILVTPELVHPLEACETPPLPGADMYEPGDVEFFLLNRMESRRKYDFRSPVRTDWWRYCNYHRCEDRFIIGPYGHTYGCCPSPGGYGGPPCGCPPGGLDGSPRGIERMESGPGATIHQPQPFIETTPFAEPVPPGEFEHQ
jgi:pilus assembly protein CpaC